MKKWEKEISEESRRWETKKLVNWIDTEERGEPQDQEWMRKEGESKVKRRNIWKISTEISNKQKRSRSHKGNEKLEYLNTCWKIETKGNRLKITNKYAEIWRHWIIENVNYIRISTTAAMKSASDGKKMLDRIQCGEIVINFFFFFFLQNLFHVRLCERVTGKKVYVALTPRPLIGVCQSTLSRSYIAFISQHEKKIGYPRQPGQTHRWRIVHRLHDRVIFHHQAPQNLKRWRVHERPRGTGQEGGETSEKTGQRKRNQVGPPPGEWRHPFSLVINSHHRNWCRCHNFPDCVYSI